MSSQEEYRPGICFSSTLGSLHSASHHPDLPSKLATIFGSSSLRDQRSAPAEQLEAAAGPAAAALHPGCGQHTPPHQPGRGPPSSPALQAGIRLVEGSTLPSIAAATCRQACSISAVTSCSQATAHHQFLALTADNMQAAADTAACTAGVPCPPTFILIAQQVGCLVHEGTCLLGIQLLQGANPDPGSKALQDEGNASGCA